MEISLATDFIMMSLFKISCLWKLGDSSSTWLPPTYQWTVIELIFLGCFLNSLTLDHHQDRLDLSHYYEDALYQQYGHHSLLHISTVENGEYLVLKHFTAVLNVKKVLKMNRFFFHSYRT